MVDVLTLGEAMAALRPRGPVRAGATVDLSVAGAESNVAIALARLGHRARWVGVVGSDRLGELVVQTLRAEGVDVSHIRTAAAPTGIVLFETRLPGVTRVNYHRTGSAGSLLSTSDVLKALTPLPRAVHVTGVTVAIGHGPAAAVSSVVERARDLGALVCFDVNYRARLWSLAVARAALRPLIGYVDVVVGSPEEIALVAPTDASDAATQINALLSAGPTEVVVKRGRAGADVYTAAGPVHAEARPVIAVDPIGAGDAFTAGYLSGWLDGLPIPERLHRAVTLGAFAVSGTGDWESLPTRDELPLLEEEEGKTLR
ncbi:MAG TPA: sugar kinase [Micromonosporaceae bacterium]|nr:sugar kinase [Micromonosporaceae bacterium]